MDVDTFLDQLVGRMERSGSKSLRRWNRRWVCPEMVSGSDRWWWVHFPDGEFQSHGGIPKWLLYKGKSHRSKFMMNRGTPMTKRKPSNDDRHSGISPKDGIWTGQNEVWHQWIFKIPHFRTDPRESHVPGCRWKRGRRWGVKSYHASWVFTCLNLFQPSKSPDFPVELMF